jgi:RimJ/RimL family protein N-acetyltransferase
VVTEYGVAYLHGKSVQERAMALIAIAAPEFRSQLLEEAIEAKYIRREMADVKHSIGPGPRELRTSYLMNDGTQITFRSIHPTDEKGMKKLFYGLSEQSVYYRFMSRVSALTQKQLQSFVYIDHRQEVSVVGTLPEAHGEEIIAVGGYFLDPKTNRAEVAFITHDKWQNRGIGTFLFKYLTSIARSNGIGGFTAEVLRANKGMQAVLNKSSLKMQSHLEGGVVSYDMEFE